jgi:hypothetical protein
VAASPVNEIQETKYGFGSGAFVMFSGLETLTEWYIQVTLFSIPLSLFFLSVENELWDKFLFIPIYSRLLYRC